MEKKRELLHSVTKKDLEVQTFRAGGPGGQHQNKRETGVRIIHRDSGAVGECRNTRSQAQNKKKALQRLVETTEFKLWNMRKCHEIMTGKKIENVVDELMEPENLRVETLENNKWVQWKE
jgi:protein subunit release factor B